MTTCFADIMDGSAQHPLKIRSRNALDRRGSEVCPFGHRKDLELGRPSLAAVVPSLGHRRGVGDFSLQLEPVPEWPSSVAR